MALIEGLSIINGIERGCPLDSTFPKSNDGAAQANAVRSYLQRHGGMMDVTVRDSPGVQAPTVNPVDKERLLTFDCGLQGAGRRIHAWQYLIVKSGLEPAQWTRQFQWNNNPPGLKTSGLTRVQPPASVTAVKPGFIDGESGMYS